MKIIEVWKSGGQWVALFKNDPVIMDLFGTNILPTAFTDAVSAEVVFSQIQSKNPDHGVIVYTS